MKTSGTTPCSSSSRLVLDDRGDGDVVPAQDAGDLGHHAGAVVHVEPQVESAGHVVGIADGRPARLALVGPEAERAEGDRRAAQRPCRSCRRRRPRRWASARRPGRGKRPGPRRRPPRARRCTPRGPGPAASGADQRRRDVQLQPLGHQLGHRQQLDAVAQLLGVAHVGHVDLVDAGPRDVAPVDPAPKARWARIASFWAASLPSTSMAGLASA